MQQQQQLVCSSHSRTHSPQLTPPMCAAPPPPPQMCFTVKLKKEKQFKREFALTHELAQQLISGTGAAYVTAWLSSSFSFFRTTRQTYFCLVLARLIRRMACVQLHSHKKINPRVFPSTSKRKKLYLQAAAPTRPPSSRHW